MIVQKYGGTSLKDIEKIKSVAKRIAKQASREQIVVVVSALGDTTDQLIELAHKIDPNPDSREMDMLVSTGEQISAALLCMALHQQGCKAISLNASQVMILTDSVHRKARIKEIETQRIEKELAEKKVVIITGFQGVTENDDITTLGRGGSDTTAVALASALDAEACEIYTDVAGVYTGDPKIIPSAKKIDVISYDEMLEMASSGAQVMQTRAVEFAKKHRVCLHIRSSFTEDIGTLVCEEVFGMEDVLVSGITANPQEAKITVVGVPDKPGVAAKIFTALAEKEINVDMIIQSSAGRDKNDISFTVNREDLQDAISIMEEKKEEIGAENIISDNNIAKVSIVGVGMRSHSGVAAKMFASLAERKINIDMISTSEIKISCVIQREKMEEAARALHTAFGLD
jgi:aspartate kinase